MMKVKKSILIAFVLLLFIIIGGVSASDDSSSSDLQASAVDDTLSQDSLATDTSINIDPKEDAGYSSADNSNSLNDTTELSADDADSKQTVSSNVEVVSSANAKTQNLLGAGANSDLLGASADKDILGATLASLQTLINQNGNTKTLTDDYVVGQNSAEYARITIDKNLVINGNNHIINANGRGTIFYITGTRTVTFNNVIFSNAGYSLNSNDGGAVHIAAGSTVTFNNCQFLNNAARNNLGGAVTAVQGGTLTFSNCNFTGNSAVNYGGVVYAPGYYTANNYYYQTNVAVSFTNCNFNHNSAQTGAVLYTNAASFTSGNVYMGNTCTFTNCKIYNSASSVEAALYLCYNTITINNCDFENNTGLKDGGAMHVYRTSNNPLIINNTNFTANAATGIAEDEEGRGGAVRVSFCPTVYIDNCIFKENTAMYGAGIYSPTNDGNSRITNSKFYNNTGSLNGGAIYWNANGDYFTNCDFRDNRADNGAGIFLAFTVQNTHIERCNFTNNSAISNGGAINGAYEEDTVYVTSSNFIDNTANNGGALAFGRDTFNVYVENSNFTGNGASNEGGSIFYQSNGETIHVTSSNFDSNYAGTGGAIHLFSSSMSDSYKDVEIINCNFTKNNSTSTDASYGGSAIGMNWASDVTIQNCKFDGNNATANGAIFLDYCYDIDISNVNFTNNYAARFGGAFYFFHAIGNADVSFRNIIFDKNYAGRSGGAISTSLFSANYENLNNLYKNWVITNCNFTDNTAALSGGAAYLPWLVDASIYNLKFDNNSGGGAGALYISGNDLNAYNINFTNNKAVETDGGALTVAPGSSSDFSKFNTMLFINNSAYGNGGAVSGTASNINLTNMNFTNNSAWYGGGLYWYTGSNLIITEQTYFNNSANNAGAVDIYNTANTNLTKTVFINNTAENDAGAVWFNSDNGIVDGCVFVNNTAKNGVAGALYLDSNMQNVQNCNFENNTAGGNGGAIYDSGRGADNSNTIKNATFITNTAYNGGGAYISDGRVTQINNSTFIDNVASHNGGGAYVLIDNANAYVDYDLFDGTGVEKNTTEKITRSTTGNRDFIVDSYFIDNVDYPIDYEVLVDGLNGFITVTAPADATVSRNGKVTYKYSYSNESGTYTRPTQQAPAEGDFVDGVVTVTIYEEHIGQFNVTLGFQEDTYLYKEFTVIFETKDARGDFTILQGYIDAAIANGIYEYNLTRSFTYTLGFDEHGNPLDDGQMYINHSFTLNGNGYTINALGVCRIFNITADNVVLNNITFANGVTDFTNSKGVFEGSVGGAIYWEGANGQINDCVFDNNSATLDGGALFVDHDTDAAKIFNTNFTDNRAVENGGAIDWNASSGDVENSYFFNNSATNGGAIFVGHDGGDGKVINSIFVNNTANTDYGHGGAIDWNASHGDVETSTFINNTAYDGGAIFVGESSSTGVIANSTFINNSATKNGGAVDWNASSGFLENSTFINNSADYGGAVFRGGGSYNGSGYNNTFIGNHARFNGGAVDWNGTAGNIKDSLFINNTADVNGGAVFVGASGTTGILVNSTFINNSAKEHGGAVDWFASSGDLENSIFDNNSAKYGGAIFVGMNSATGKIINSTFTNNNAEINGGAIDWNASSGFLENSTFINNSADNGGAVFRGGGSYNGSGYNNTFISNHARVNGGAVDWNGTAGNIRDSVFINNTADVDGGAVFVGTNATNGSIVNSTFINNSAVKNGGAVDWNSSGGALNGSYFQDNSAEYGGAVFVGGSSSTGLIFNTTFINNTAAKNGGAVDWNASSGFVEWSTFINNTADNGGALYRGGGSYNGSSYNNTFISNHATYNGGAVDWASTGGNIRDSTFINNTAGNLTDGGEVATIGHGGAVFIGAVSTDGEVVNGTIINTTFTGNSATGDGGAINWNSSGGNLDVSYFENNTARNGGAVFVGMASSTGKIYNTTFINNTASQNGGAVDWNASSGFVEWSTFIENSADYGGALYRGGGSYEGSSYNNTFILNHADHNGGAVLWASTGGNIMDSTFINNTAGVAGDEAIEGNGGAVFIGADGATGRIINTTFFNNSATKNGGAIDWNATGGYVENSTFENNTAYDGGALYRGGSAETGSGFNNTFISNAADHDGGAIYWAQSSINIANYTFENNVAGNDGGAIFAGTVGEGGSVVNSTFKGNNATSGKGGAIDWDASQGTVENSTFDQNAAQQGGAIHIGSTSSKGQIISSNFTDNVATISGGAIEWDGASGQVNGSLFEDNKAPKGAAIYIGDEADEMTVTESEFNSNTASEEGGAIYVNQVKNVSVTNASFNNNSAEHGGAIFADNCENFTVDRSNFTENTAVNDGAIHWGGEDGIISNSNFTRNHADESGGALGWKGVTGTIVNATFTSNSAGESGGAVLWYGNDTDTIANSTFTSNTAFNGGAIYWIDGDGGTVTNSTFTTNVGYDKGGAISVFNNTNHVIVNSTFDSNKAPGYFNEEGIQYGTGGAIYSEKVTGILIQNDTFTNNIAALNGGAIALNDTNSSTINNVSITGSKADTNGGSIYWVSSEEILINATAIKDSEAHDLGGSIYVKEADGNIENTTIDGSTAKYDSAGAIYVDGDLVLNHTELSNFNSLNNVATAILFDGGESYLEDSTLNGKNAVVVSAEAKAHLIENTITDDSGDYSLLNNGDLWLDMNEFDDVIINNGIIETQTYTVILENGTYTVLEGETAILNATIEDDNGNIIVVTNDDFFAVTPDGSSQISYVPAYYTGRVNYGDYENVAQGVYLVSANNADLKMNEIQTGVLRVQAKTNLAITVEKTNEGKLVVIAATPYPSDGIPYVGNVTFAINGIARDPIELVNGVAELTMEDVPAGTYQVSAFYTGDTYHTNASNETLFIINKIPVGINISIEDIVYGQNATAVANLSNNANGTVIFLLNGRKEVPIDEDGHAVWEDIAGLAPGNYTITAVYSGNEYFDMAYNETTFEVSKANTTIVAVAEPNTVEYRQEQLINVQLNTSATGTVKVTINGIEYFADVTAGGNAVVNVTGLPIGEYSSIEVLYSGDDYFNANNTTVSFGVTPMNVTKIKTYDIDIIDSDIDYGENEEIEIRLPTDATGTVKVLVDGVEIANRTIGVDNLIFTVPKPFADEKHNITVIYSGDDIYDGKTIDTESFKVSPVDPDLTLNVLNISYMQNETIEIVLPGDAEGTVTISLNGEQFGEPVAVSEGKATITIPTDGLSYLEAGTYEVTATYSGDGNYNSMDAVNTFTVSKIASDISVSAINVDYGEDEIITLVLGVTNASGKVNVTLIDLTIGDVVKSEIVDMTTGSQEITYTDALDAGSYRVDVEYYGDKNYLNSTSSASFEVNKMDAEVTVAPANITYNESEIISVIAPADATGNVTITIDAGDAIYTITKNLTEAVIDDDKANLTFVLDPDTYPLNAGRYIVFANYSGDRNYNSVEVKNPFDVAKAASEVAIAANTIPYGKDELINVTVTGVDGELITDGFVTIKIGSDIEITNPIGSDGVARFNVTGLVVNDYSVNATFNGNDNYNISSSLEEFSVIKADITDMSVDPINITYGNDENIAVTIADTNATGTVYLEIYDGEDLIKTTDKVTVANGMAQFSIPDLAISDDYKVIAYYGDDVNYNDNDATGFFKVEKASPDVTVTPVNITYGNVETIKITIPNKNVTGNITITIAGISKSVNVTGGVGEINFTDLDVGNYSTTALYHDDVNYLDVEIPISFEVVKTAPVSIEVTPQNITYGQIENITVTVNGIEGFDAPTGNVTISVDIGDVIYTNTTDLVDGVARFNITGLNVSNYRVFATYNGDDKYDSIADTQPFYVYKAPTSLDVEVANIQFGEDELVNVTVIGVEDGETPTLFITIVVNGTSVNMSREVDSDGVARFNVTGLLVGEYEVNATYTGDSNYNGSSGIGRFNVTKTVPISLNITASNITYGDDETITVIISDESATGNLTISIGDYTDTKEISRGQAVFVVEDLEAGDYTVKVGYSGDANHDAISVLDGPSKDFTVFKASSSTVVTPIDIIYKQNETINVSVSGVHINDLVGDNLTGSVTIFIDGVENQTKSISEAVNGILQFTVEGLSVGDHRVSAKYHDDRNYNDSEDVKAFNVANTLPEDMTVIPQNITYHIGTETITIDLGEVLSGNLQLFIVKDSVETLVQTFTVEDQQVITSNAIENLAVGEYIAKAIFTANGDSVEASAPFHVSKAPTTVVVNADDSSYGDDQVITVYVDNSAADKFNLTGNVSITLNGIDYGNKSVDANGQAVFVITGLEANENYVVTATYYADDNYQNSTGQDDFKVSKTDVEDINKEINAVDIVYGNDETITVILNEENITGNITITIGDYTDTKTLDEGSAVFTVAGLEVGEYTVVADYSGDVNYNGFEGLTDTFEVEKAKSTVEITAIPSIVYGDEETITVSVPVSNHTGNITITINGTDYQFIKNMTAEPDSFTLTDVGVLDVGTYNITARYTGDRNYNDSEASFIFEVTKDIPSQVTIESQNITYGQDEIITVTVGDENAGGNVSISINGETRDEWTKELENGQVKFNISGLAVDHYIVEATYSGDANYDGAKVSDIFKVEKAASNITVAVENITYGDVELANVTIPNYNASGRVIIKVDGRAYEISSIDNETPVRLELEDLSAGVHTIDVEYIEDSNYNNSVAHVEFTVFKKESSVSVVPTDIDYGADEIITVTVPITNATGTVVVKVNGSVVDERTVSGDEPSYNVTVTGLAVGEYNVTVEYSDDVNYEDSNNSALFTVGKAVIPVDPSDEDSLTVVPTNITYGDDENIVVSVGAFNATGIVTIYINGTEVASKNITADGSQSVTFVVEDLAAGEYNVTAKYHDDVNYEDAETSALFHVDKAESSVIVTPINIEYGADETITVTVPIANATGTVVVKVDGQVVDERTVTGDEPSYTVTVSGLSAGEHNVTVEYSDDVNYNDSDNSATFTVSKAVIPVDPSDEDSLTVVPTNITYGDDETIVVSVGVDNATGIVTIYINGTEIESKNITADGSQSVTFTVPGIAAGEYNVTAKYHDDVNYEDAETSALFHVDKAESSVTVTPVNIEYGADETITVSVPITNASGTVVVKVNGSVVDERTVSGDEPGYTVTVTGLAAGEYNVTVEYSDDVNYNDSDNSATFTVSKAVIPVDPSDEDSLTVVPTNITYGDDETIVVSVGADNATGIVTIYINGTEIESKNITADGSQSVTFVVEDLAAGEYNVTVKYHDDVNYEDAETSALFHVDKAESSVTVTPVNITYGADETITVTVPITNATGTVVVKVNDTVVDERTVTGDNPSYTVTVTGLAAGEYNVTVEYSDDVNYEDSNNSALFTVSKAVIPVDPSDENSLTVVPTNITYGDDETIVVSVGADNATGIVTIYINGTEIESRNITADGSQSVTFVVEDLAVGEYNVTVKYHDDVNYEDAETSALFHVDKAESSVTVVPTDISYGDDETITVTVPITNASGTVVVKVDGQVVDERTVTGDNPSYTVTVSGLSAGEHTVTVEYSDDVNYNDSENSATFTVGKAASNVSVTPTDITYGEDEAITVSVPITNATGTVVVKVDGQVVDERTLSGDNPSYTVTVSDLAAGEHTVTVEYSDDVNYADSEDSATFTVGKAVIPVDPSDEDSLTVVPTNITYGDDETIVVSVGVDNATGIVTIYINGTEIESKNITADGSQSVTFTLPGIAAGEYNVTAKYHDDVNYEDAETSALFHVDKASSSVSVTPTDITYGEDETITVTVPIANATGTVVVKVDGEVVDERTVSGDEPSYTVTVSGLSAGEHNVAVEYSNDVNYNDSDNSATFTVSKAVIPVDPSDENSLTVVPTDITYGDDESIVVSVGADNATGIVTIYINGTEVASKNITADGSQSVTFAVPGIAAGEYNVTAKYHDDVNYEDAETSALFHVDKAESSVTVTPTDITYGDDETITVSVPIANATGTVVVKVDGEVVDERTVSGDNPSFTVTVSDLAAGEHNVAVEYRDDVNYADSEDSGSFTIDKAVPHVEIHVEDIVYGDVEVITITCDAPGTVYVTVNGVTIPVSLDDGHEERLFASIKGAYSGKATIDLKNLPVGTYPVVAEYRGNENYTSASDSDSFDVIQANTTTKISVDNIEVGDDAVINVEVDHQGGSGPINANITVTVDGTEHTVEIKNGKGSLTVPGLSVGTHTVKASYPGSENYAESSDDATFKVTKQTAAVKVNAEDINVGDDETITVSVPDDATGNVTITVNGKEYTAPVKNGKATFEIPGLKAGKYSVNAVYSGDDKYKSSTGKAAFKVSKVKPEVVVDAPEIEEGEDGTITVTVPDDATGTITIEIDGKNYTSSIKNGKAVFHIKGLSSGSHGIKVYYSGDDKYLSTSGDGGSISVIAKEHGGSHSKAQGGISLADKKTGNPLVMMVLVLFALVLVPLKRSKKDEDEEEEK